MQWFIRLKKDSYDIFTLFFTENVYIIMINTLINIINTYLIIICMLLKLKIDAVL